MIAQRTSRLKPRTAAKPRKKLGVTDFVLIILLCSLLIGLIGGIVMCNLTDEAQFNTLTLNISNFFNSIKTTGINSYEVFFEAMIKYGKTLIIIWFLAFLPLSTLISVIIIFSKGMSCSFTSAILIKEFGVDGFLYSLPMYLPQNIIIIPVYIYVAYSGATFVLAQIVSKRLSQGGESVLSKRHIKLGLKDIFCLPTSFERKSFLDYLKAFVIGICCVVAASLIEAFVVPGFI